MASQPTHTTTERAGGWRIYALTAGCTALIALGAQVLAGQPPRGVPTMPGQDAEEAMSLDEIREFQSFRYIGGGRDPMTFRKAKEEAQEGPTAAKAATGAIRATGEVPKAEKIKVLRQEIMKIETLMLAHDYEGARKPSEEVLERVAAEWGLNQFDPDPEINRLFRKIVSYERTAKRLQQAKEIRKEFEGLELAIKGIRWTPTGTAAAVNDDIYEPGGVIEIKGMRTPVQIESIEENAVVFVYKGQRFRKEVGTTTDEK